MVEVQGVCVVLLWSRMFVLSKGERGGWVDPPALCCSWASADVRGRELSMEYTLCNCCWGGDTHQWLRNCNEARVGPAFWLPC